MYTIFMNSENSKTSGLNRLLLILTEEINLKRNMLFYQIVTYNIHGKI